MPLRSCRVKLRVEDRRLNSLIHVATSNSSYCAGSESISTDSLDNTHDND